MLRSIPFVKIVSAKDFARKVAFLLAFIVLFSSVGLPFTNADEFSPAQKAENIFTQCSANHYSWKLLFLNFYEEEDTKETDKITFSYLLFNTQHSILYSHSLPEIKTVAAIAARESDIAIFILTGNFRI